MSDPRSTSRVSGEALLADSVPLISAIPLYGPPIIFFAGPWILVALLLFGPFALLMTLVVALLAVRLLIVALVAIAVAPVLLARHLRSRWADRPSFAPAALPAAHPPLTTT